ncbi:MAG: 30S ribosomal protein S9 [Actinomycetota bacterium]|nr:30S ribosomal protein S9 [Actinomycetota bacterium]
MAEEVKYYATGRRKESTAKVWIKPGEGKIIVNEKDFKEYFPRDTLVNMIIEPFNLTGTQHDYDVIASIEGGGVSGQAGALRHGISKALLEINPEYRIILKKEGFLTRDSRIKERKKYGLKKARKRSQFSKR